jgi:hypothetical protein
VRRIGIGAIACAGMLAAAAHAEPHVFVQPAHDDYRVDLCRIWGYECGQAAADEFCRRNDFEHAAAFSIAHDIGAATPTMTLADRKVCDQAYCDGFESITCTRPGAALRSVSARRSTGDG